jgi:hypothetical protein
MGIFLCFEPALLVFVAGLHRLGNVGWIHVNQIKSFVKVVVMTHEILKLR